MDRWRLLRIREDTGAMQMAIDEAMLTARVEGQIPNTLRFFTWNPPAITIGYFQGLLQEVDSAAAKEGGIDIIRRYTGGGAVFHQHELTYSLVAEESLFPRDIVASYQAICGGIIGGLSLLGLDAQFRPINDIVIGEKKVSGNAQTRKKGIILQHGTILLDVDIEKMFSLLLVPDEKMRDKMIQGVKERVTSLQNVLGRTIPAEELEDCMILGFSKALGFAAVPGELTRFELEKARELHDEKYATDEWRMRR